MTDAVRVRDLTKRFGGFTAVDRISFEVREGEILGFLGPNGAGKTTTIRMILGLLYPTSGQILVGGRDVRRAPRVVKRLSGYMSQQFSLYPLLTARENVDFFGGISGLDRRSLRRKRETLEGTLPAGLERRMVLFLDEPTSGVDPEARRQFWAEIYELKERGKTILVTTHNLDEAEYADRILIINRGIIVAQGSPLALKKERGVGSVEELFKEVLRDHEAA
jgi:ABC-2 type transport system ATP-binding protein